MRFKTLYNEMERMSAALFLFNDKNTPIKPFRFSNFLNICTTSNVERSVEKHKKISVIAERANKRHV